MGTVRDALFEGQRVALARLVREHNIAWLVNGTAASGHGHTRVMTLQRGGHCVLDLINETAWHHPIHLHGMSFTVLSSSTRKVMPQVTDTYLINSDEKVELAFVADNLGDWAFHCHIIEHQKTGMTAYVRVT